MRTRALALAAAASLIVAGCGSSSTPPAPGPVASVPRAPVAPKEPDPGPSLAPIPYEAKGRRDPFTPLVIASGGKGLTIGSAKLVGVIQGRTSPLALVETSEGIGYILKAGDTLGDGRVTEIGVDFVSFAVTPRPGQAGGGSVTLRLRTD
jgi:Tfp pilus assembly protein PilP